MGKRAHLTETVSGGVLLLPFFVAAETALQKTNRVHLLQTASGSVRTIYGSPESNYLQKSGPNLSHHSFKRGSLDKRLIHGHMIMEVAIKSDNS